MTGPRTTQPALASSRVPRTELLPEGLARCGGMGGGTLHYATDQHCGDITHHKAHQVSEAAVPMSRHQVLGVIVQLAVKLMQAPIRIEFLVLNTGRFLELRFPAGAQVTVERYADRFGLAAPLAEGWLIEPGNVQPAVFASSSALGDRGELLDKPRLFGGWHVTVQCEVTR